MKMKIKHLVEDIDRHGNVRLYVRRKGVGKVRIRSLPTSPTFMAEYQVALAKLDDKAKGKGDGDKTGTLGWLVNEFEHSHDFLKLAPREQRVRHLIVRSLLDEETKVGSGYRFRDCPISNFTADHVRLLRNRKQKTPAAANHRVSNLRVILEWGKEERSAFVKCNVAAEVKPLKYESKGFHTWTEEEVAKFEQRHPVGTIARLALDLMLYTGMRRSDAVQIGPKHLTKIKSKGSGTMDTWIVFTPQKTSSTTGKTLSLPALDVLRDTLSATPHGLESYLVTSHGKPFTANGFGNWFRERCDEAGLPHCTAHGLRKIGAVRAAENGATEQQMMAIFGWDSPKLTAHYAKQASQKAMAGAAMHKLIGTK
jgi:integrase